MALIGTDAETVGRRVAELLARSSPASGRGVTPAPERSSTTRTCVVVLDGVAPAALAARRGADAAGRPAVGVHAICLDADERLLPEECQRRRRAGARRALTRPADRRRPSSTASAPDLVAGLVRAAGPLRWPRCATSAATTRARRCRPQPAARRARASSRRRATRSRPAGARARSTEAVRRRLVRRAVRDRPAPRRPARPDRRHHRLRQVRAAADDRRLARGGQPPGRMTFVLVDYKGGVGVQGLRALPHTVGMVTDLDAHLVERALESLGAELRPPRAHPRRAAAPRTSRTTSTSHGATRRSAPMPRLLIVIDEFASMVRDLPDFVTGLVNIAQRGRSLGIHLMLATQRPSGVVSPEIRANTNLRIALRVTDAGESHRRHRRPGRRRASPRAPRAAPTCGSGTRRWCRSSPAGSAAAGPARVRRDGARPWSAPLAWDDPGPAGAGAAGGRARRRRGDHRPHGPGGRDPCGGRAARRPGAAQPVAAGAARRLAAARTSSAGPARCDDVAAAGRRSASRTCPPSRPAAPAAIDFATFGHLLIAGAPAQRPFAGAAHARRLAGPHALRRPTCTSTASTAATARCCR